MGISYTMRQTDHSQTPVAVASSFVFDTSKFGGKHAPATAKKIAAAKRALREATLLHEAALAAIEGRKVKPAPSDGTLVICSRRVRFTRTEKQHRRIITGHDGPDQSRVLEGSADAVVEVFDLAPGVPTIVPAWCLASKHFASLQKDGALSSL